MRQVARSVNENVGFGKQANHSELVVRASQQYCNYIKWLYAAFSSNEKGSIGKSCVAGDFQ
jgi:hypothetical protein